MDIRIPPPVIGLERLSTAELAALATEASSAGDSGRAIAYLKEAVRRGASAPACFLLASECAQLGQADEAIRYFSDALAVDPGYDIARFQLGFLHFVHARVGEAFAVWGGLAGLGADHPLNLFRVGLEHLARDEFDACVSCLRNGISANGDNPALNANMACIVAALQNLPASTFPSGSRAVEPEGFGHLFLSTYGKEQLH